MKRKIRAGFVAVSLGLLLNEKAFAERLNLGEGLTIDEPATEAISYRSIPSFNASKKMLQRHNDEKLQYFVSIDRLSRGSNNAAVYFERLLRDINDASIENSLKILDQGEYWTLANVRANYVDYVFTPAGSNRPQHQIVHFLTNTYRNYVAIAVLVDAAAEQQMHDETIALFNTASISTTNTPMPAAPSANR